MIFKKSKHLIMGTRSIIRFQSRKNKESTVIFKYVTIYQQYDGYDKGYKLEKFIRKCKIVNGLSNDIVPEGTILCNGYECLIAQFIAKYKTKPGDFYITEIDAPDEEVNYVVTYYTDDGSIKIN